MPGNQSELEATRRQRFFQGRSLIRGEKIMEEVNHESDRAYRTPFAAGAETQ